MEVIDILLYVLPRLISPSSIILIRKSKIISVSSSGLKDSDLTTNCHTHQLLITIVDTDSPSSLSLLHHWQLAHTQSSSARAILTKLSPSTLPLIRGFRDLGTHQLPVAQASDVVERHSYLSSLVTADRSDQENPLASNEAELISRLVERLHREPAPQSQGVSIRMFAIPVLSDSTETLLTGGPAPVWKWAKPESTYGRITGFWETDMERAIKDGEWNAGKELHLLVQGVSEERREELRTGRVRCLARG